MVRETVTIKVGTRAQGLNWLVLAPAIVLAAYTVAFTYHAVHLLGAPGELNYAEGTWLFAAARVRHGLSPYFDYTQLPFIPMFYPPLDAWLSGLTAGLLNLNDEQVPFAARLVTLVATLAVSGGVFVCCRRSGVGVVTALVAALVFLTPADVLNRWGVVARGDMLAVAFGTWGVAALLSVTEGTKRWGVLIAGALCALALWTKQTALAPTLAALWSILASRRWSGLYLFGGSFAGTFAAMMLLIWPRDLFLLARATLDIASNPWNIDFLLARTNELLTMFAPLLPIALLGCLQPAGQVPNARFFRGYLLAAAGVLAITSGKVGSASSYCLETVAVLSVLTGLGIKTCLDWRELGVPPQLRRSLAVLVLVPLSIQAFQGTLAARQAVGASGPDDRALRAALVQAGGPIFSDNGYVVLDGATPPVILDPYYFAILSSYGRWDSQPLEKLVERAYFGSIALRAPLEELAARGGLPGGVLRQMQANYHLSSRQGGYYVYTRTMSGSGRHY